MKLKRTGILLALLFLSTSGTSALAADQAMNVTAADYDIFVYPDGSTYVRVAAGLATKMTNPTLACDTNDNDLLISTTVNDRALVALYTGRSIGASMQFGVSDTGVVSNGTCVVSYIIIKPAT